MFTCWILQYTKILLSSWRMNALDLFHLKSEGDSRYVNLGHIKFDVDLDEPVDSNSSAEYIKEWFLQRYQVRILNPFES